MENYLAVALFCLVSTITPGPNNVLLMSTGLNHGIRKSLPHICGVFIGFPLMVAILGFGLGAIFLSYPVIHSILKVVGVSYLLFLAWKIANTGNSKSSPELAKPLTFMQAFGFQWANPKGWIIAIGALSTFTTQDNVIFDVLVVVFGFLLLGSISMFSWLLLGASLQKVLRQEKQLTYFNRTMAILLVISILPMIGI